MDLFRFINSKDIRTHLEQLNYCFSAPEAAYLVFFSYKATLDEKISAWQEIRDTMPDCAMDKRLNLPPIPSFHGFLAELIGALRKGVSDFLYGENCVYSYSCHSAPSFCGDDGWREESRLFSSFTACRKACEADDRHPDADLIRIRRRRIYHDSSPVCDGGDTYLFLNQQVQFMLPPSSDFLLSNDPILLQFFFMWFDIPTPFRCGDIVQPIRPYGESGQTRVLYYLPTWGSTELLKRDFPPTDPWLTHADKILLKARKQGDCSDMQAYGCGYDEDGQLRIGDDGFATNYLDLEYAKEPLEGVDRLLYGLQEYLKGTIDAEILVNSSRLILLEETCRQQQRNMDTYKSHILKAVGLDALIGKEGLG